MPAINTTMAPSGPKVGASPLRSISFLAMLLLVSMLPIEGLVTLPNERTLIFYFVPAVGVLVVATANTRQSLTIPLPLAFLGLYLVWAIISALWAWDSYAAVSSYVPLLGAWTVAWLTYTTATDEKRLRLLALAFILGCTVAVLAQMFSFRQVAPVSSIETAQLRYSGEMLNANDLAIALALAVGLTGFVYTNSKMGGITKLLLLTYTPLALLGVLLTGSRTGTVVLAIATGLLFWQMWNSGARAYVWLLAVVGAGTLFTSLLIVPDALIQRISEVGQSGGIGNIGTFSYRTSLWQAGLTTWTESPIIGTGLGSYREAAYAAGQDREVSHNILVGVLVECGVVGLLWYGLFLWSITKACMKLPFTGRFVTLGLLTIWFIASLTTELGYRKYAWYLLGWLTAASTVLGKSVGDTRPSGRSHSAGIIAGPEKSRVAAGLRGARML